MGVSNVGCSVGSCYLTDSRVSFTRQVFHYISVSITDTPLSQKEIDGNKGEVSFEDTQATLKRVQGNHSGTVSQYSGSVVLTNNLCI